MKRIFSISAIFTIVLCLLSFSCVSQNWLWAKSATGTGNDYANSVAVDVSGNTFVSGNFESPSIIFGSTTLINSNTDSTADIFLEKLDASGSVLWAKSFGGTKNDETYSVTTDDSGNVYLAGFFYSNTLKFDTTTLINTDTNYCDLFLVKLNASGNVLWAKSATGNDNDEVYSVAADTAGNVCIAGCFYSDTLIFGSDTLANSGLFDIFIAKYDGNGNLLLAKSAGGTGYDGASAIALDGSGNAYLAGWFESPTLIFGSVTLTNAGYEDIFLVKYDTGGNVVWAKSAGGTDDDNANSLALDPSGNIYMIGDFYSSTLNFGSTTLTNTGGDNLFIAKYDNSGNVQWAKSAQGNADGKSVIVGTSGNIYMAGDFGSPTLSFGTITLKNADTLGNTNDIFLTKFDAGGNTYWAKSIGGKDDEGANSIALDASGSVYVAGWFYSPMLSFPPDSLINTDNTGNTDDIFIAKLSSSTGINELTSSLNTTIYPNPAKTKITIETSQQALIEILNIQGQIIKTMPTNVNKTIIDVSSFTNGMYFVKVKTENDMTVKKFVKE
ncbi:MAG: T9SS type A sorting domain-containing protein [Bacteroidales bacterium]|jgi:hypothetical protein